jgi:hypothetical protein
MPITVELWTELSEPIVEARVIDVTIPMEVATDQRFPLLKWVDPWGDTVFNGAQCAALVAELVLAGELFGASFVLGVHRGLKFQCVGLRVTRSRPRGYI